MAGEDSRSPLPSTPESPTSAGFNTDQLPHDSSHSSDEEEAAVDPAIIRDEVDDVEEEEDEGEDLYNDNFMDDYRGMDGQDQYESVGLDESMEDERDLDQIMQDRRAAELELEARDARLSSRKLPQLLYDQGLYPLVFFFVMEKKIMSMLRRS